MSSLLLSPTVVWRFPKSCGYPPSSISRWHFPLWLLYIIITMIFPLLLSHYNNLINTIIIHRRYFPWNKPSRGTPPQQTPRTLKGVFAAPAAHCRVDAGGHGGSWEIPGKAKIRGKSWQNGGFYTSKTLNGYGSIPINTIFNGMNIHLPAILGFTRYQGFWPHPQIYVDLDEFDHDLTKTTSLEWWLGQYQGIIPKPSAASTIIQPDGCVWKWGNTNKGTI